MRRKLRNKSPKRTKQNIIVDNDPETQKVTNIINKLNAIKNYSQLNTLADIIYNIDDSILEQNPKICKIFITKIDSIISRYRHRNNQNIKQTLISILTTMLKLCDIDMDQQMIRILIQIDVNLLSQHILRKKTFDQNQTYLIFNMIEEMDKIKNSYYGYNNVFTKESIINFINEHINKPNVFVINSECIKIACKYRMLTVVLKYINDKILFTLHCVDEAIKNDDVIMYDTFVPTLFELDKEHLEIACENNSILIATHLLNQKIIPTNNCFKAIFQKNKILKKSTKKEILFKRSKMINLLFKYGYKPNVEDILIATKHHHIIDNLNIFDIQLDESFIQKCSEFGFIPYKEYKLSPTIECLEYECGISNNLQTITNLIKNGLTPNIKCIKAACELKSNMTVIKFLLENFNLKLDLECIKSVAISCNYSNIVYLLNKYDEGLNKTDVINSSNINDMLFSYKQSYKSPANSPKKITKSRRIKKAFRRSIMTDSESNSDCSYPNVLDNNNVYNNDNVYNDKLVDSVDFDSDTIDLID
jgi:hypothetical protein